MATITQLRRAPSAVAIAKDELEDLLFHPALTLGVPVAACRESCLMLELGYSLSAPLLAYIDWTLQSEILCMRSLQTNSSIPIVRQNMDMPAILGGIFYNSIAQNQSYAVSGMQSDPGGVCTITIMLLVIYHSTVSTTACRGCLR